MNLGALVLAAGKGTRIEARAGGRPKPLLEIAGRTLIDWNLSWLAAAGISEAWVNLHYHPEAIRAALGTGEGSGLRVRYSHEETMLGTAGAWKRLEQEWTGTSLVVYGDNLMRFDLEAFLAAHRAGGAPATVALFDADRHTNTGIAGGHAELDVQGRITCFREGEPAQPGMRRLVNAGAYLLEPEVSRWVPPGFQDFGRDVFPRLAPAAMLHAHVIEPGGFCLGVDTPERFDVAERLIDSGEVVLP